MNTPLLQVRHLKKYFPVRGGLLRRVVGHLKAVDDVSFDIPRGQTLGLVGESGCGKSTLGRAILRLHEPSGGQVLLDGTEITALNRRELVAQRRKMQIVFQDPYASLSPRRTVMQTLLEPMETHGMGTPESRREKVHRLLEIVGMRPEVLDRYPHEFSGGQRQRIGIARALTLDPQFIVADEAVSALDVSVQSQVLNLIARLQRELGISFLFISHDLAVVQHVSHQVGVMYLGRLVELAPAMELYRAPRHPYTQALLSAVPVPDPKGRPRRILLAGEVPSPLDPPSGCPFRTRCPQAMLRCAEAVPPLRPLLPGDDRHQVACHLYQ